MTNRLARRARKPTPPQRTTRGRATAIDALPTRRKRRQRRSQPRLPQLRFTPYAWAKLIYLRDLGDTEIGGFGVATPDDPLLVTDIRLVRQRCDWARVELDDAAVAELFDDLVDEGRRPEEFGRIWIHTHPGSSAAPSGTDEATFRRAFGRCDWAVMMILARGGATYARLSMSAGPGLAVAIETAVEFTTEFPAADSDAWTAEYRACILPAAETGERPFEQEPVDPWAEFDNWIWNLADTEAACDESALGSV